MSIRFFGTLSLAIGLFYGCTFSEKKNHAISGKKWWKEAVVYQIYPRSFQDSDGDGVGDLKGIISKLDYIKSLGVDVIWLNPIYTSPNFDNGYDISDYRGINEEFGTMADFDALLKGLHDRNIKLVMDMVVNHSSAEHEWFKQSRSSRTNPYRKYYHWWPAEKGKPSPRFSFFDVNADGWQFDSLTNAYYLHYFADQQPDLNWENPQVRKEVIDIMKFWAAKGIDGFRLDAFQYAAKDTTWPVYPNGFEKNVVQYYGMRPQIHDYIKEMNREVFGPYDLMTVAEGSGSTFQDAHELVDADRNELNMAYHFDAIDIGKATGEYSLLDFKKIYSRWDSAFATNGWLSIYLANHDNARMVSRFGNDSPEFRDLSSKMLTTFIMTMKGTPYYYYGDELGMTNIRFPRIEDYNDIDAINSYKRVQQEGGDLNKLLQFQARAGRDNGRTPMQWDDSAQSGFTTGKPWLKVNPNYPALNVKAEEADSNSVLNYFKKIVALRKSTPALIYGKYTLVDQTNPSIYAYTRELDGDRLLILLNFKAQRATLKTNLNLSSAEFLLGNYPDAIPSETLRPYETMVIRLR